MPSNLTEVWHLFNNGGPHAVDIVLFIFRFAVGFFFAATGYHKLAIPERRTMLQKTLQQCGVWPWLWWFVAGVEFLAGLAVIAGVLTQLAEVGLLIILMVAFTTASMRHLRKMELLDPADYCVAALAMPEVAWAIVLVGLLLMGPGQYTLYAVISHYGFP